jgi:glycosyltransferase involved in cell wall biosynthesis
MRIITLSTHGEPCGIATYDDHLRAALSARGHLCDVHPIDRTLLESRARREVRRHFRPFIERLGACDAVVLQHEFGLYAGAYGVKASNAAFSHILGAVRRTRKRCCVIFHTERPAFPRRRGILGMVRRSRPGRDWAAIVGRIASTPEMMSVVHGSAIRRSLVDDGVPEAKVLWVPHPTPEPLEADTTRPSISDGGVVRLAIFGFVSAYKGYETALRALSVLPPNFTLTIAGGPHPRGGGDRTLDQISGILATGRFANGTRVNAALLRERVEVTGWLAVADAAATLARADIILAPYDEHGPAGSGAVATAIAAGRPLIATRVRTFNDIAANYACMDLVAPDAPFELAYAIRRLAADQERQASLVAEARRFAAENSWSGFAERIEAVLSR